MSFTTVLVGTLLLREEGLLGLTLNEQTENLSFSPLQLRCSLVLLSQRTRNRHSRRKSLLTCLPREPPSPQVVSGTPDSARRDGREKTFRRGLRPKTMKVQSLKEHS